MNRVLAIGAICLVCGALVAGLLVVGGPTRARNLKYDQTRLDDLLQIRYALSCNTPARTPTDISVNEIRAICSRGDVSSAVTDPATDEAYTFQVINEVDVKICAMFFDVAGLKKTKRLMVSSLDLRFSGNVGCFTQTVVPRDPA